MGGNYNISLGQMKAALCCIYEKINSLFTRVEVIETTIDNGGGGGGSTIPTDNIWEAKGDLAVGTGPDTAARLGVGADGEILVADSTEPTGLKWIINSGGGGGGTDVATDVIFDAKGDIPVGTGPDTAVRFPVGADGHYLTADSTEPTGLKWIASGGGGGGGTDVATDVLWNAKGDLAVGTGPDSAGRLAVGTNGQILCVDSTTATGIKWANATQSTTVANDTIFDAKGDLPVGTGADTAAKLPAGSNGQILCVDSTTATGLKWGNPSQATTVANDTIFDVKGDLPVGTGADTAARLGAGSNGQVLCADSTTATGLKWGNLPTVTTVANDAIFDAKGDLIVGTGPDASVRLPVGTNGYVLMADSADPNGVKWSLNYTDASIITTSATSIVLNDTNCWPAIIRCTSNSGIIATLQASQTNYGRYWILRQVGLGIISVSASNSGAQAVTRNGFFQSAGQNTSMSCVLVSPNTVDLEGGVA